MHHGLSQAEFAVRRDGKLLLATVGLPARGKTYIAQSIKRHMVGRKGHGDRVRVQGKEERGVSVPENNIRLLSDVWGSAGGGGGRQRRGEQALMLLSSPVAVPRACSGVSCGPNGGLLTPTSTIMRNVQLERVREKVHHTEPGSLSYRLSYRHVGGGAVWCGAIRRGAL